MPKLASIVIPCYNAQKWIAAAIESCLHQTYSPIEIIVIDDGSSDNSLEIVKRYGDRIRWETGPNQGGNYARNRGFALSQGDYIQFLDADDILLPEKIEQQVRCFEETQADVVYSDWRYQFHQPDQKIELGDIKVCGPKQDFFEELLSNKRWIPIICTLFTREIVERSGGWDEELEAAQDRDFLILTAFAGAKFAYSPGCHSLYRRYGNVTVSSQSKMRWLDNHCTVMRKTENRLLQLGNLSLHYRQALAKAYYNMGRELLYSDFPHLQHPKYLRHLEALEQALRLYPQFKVSDRKISYRLIQQFLGIRYAETTSYLTKRLQLWVKEKKANFSLSNLEQSPRVETSEDCRQSGCKMLQYKQERLN